METKADPSKETEAPRLIGAARAAESLGVSERHLRNLVVRGHLRFVRLGRRVLVPREELERLAREGTR
jgi:excisionase family DNA binding protein